MGRGRAKLSSTNGSGSPAVGDAFGHGLLAQHEGRPGTIFIERDDGLIHVDASDYFTPPNSPLWDWLRARMGQRVLDIGAGAGRAALQLQSEGLDVVALDVSPGAIEVCRRRGVAQTFAGTVDGLAATDPAPFDSLLALGNNLGLLANPAAAHAFLDALRRMSHPETRLLGTTLDPSATDDEVHLAYHDANRQAGRMAGQVTIRVRHQREATPWFELLWLAPQELAELAASAGWEMTDQSPGAIYCAELLPRAAARR